MVSAYTFDMIDPQFRFNHMFDSQKPIDRSSRSIGLYLRVQSCFFGAIEMIGIPTDFISNFCEIKKFNCF